MHMIQGLLRKNLVKFPIYLNDPNNDLEPNKYEKMLIPSNTTMNELKIIVGKFCKIPPRTVSILIPEDFFQKSMEKDLFKNLKKNELDDTFNNITLNEVLNDIETFYEVSPDKKLIFQRRRGISYREPLLINEELNPKLEKILHEWYIQYSNDEEKVKFLKERYDRLELLEEQNLTTTSRYYFVIVSDNDFKWELNEIDDEIIIRLFDTFSSKEVNIEIYYPTICDRAKYKY